MIRNDLTLDLIAKLALTGAVAFVLIRPAATAHTGSAPLLPRTRNGARTTAATSLLGWAPAVRTTVHAGTKADELGRTAMTLGRRLHPRRVPSRSAGRWLNGSAAILAFSVLADSAVEHYRGSFENRAMYTPLVAASLAFAASVFGLADARTKKHRVRDVIYALAAAAGLAGLGFHTYNILKRPGQWSWLNLFYAAPLGAPLALALAGLLGRGAEHVREGPPHRRATLFGLPAGRLLAGVSAAGLAGTVGEAGLLHFRGAYHNPAMLLPVTIPPVASVLLGASALRPRRTLNRITAWWLRLTAALGLGGAAFHVYGVGRNMGGWRNWSQNVLNGPPLPAPPSFTGLALAGLAALKLIEEDVDA